MEIKLNFEATRHVKLVRSERGTVTVVLVPRERFKKLSSEEQLEVKSFIADERFRLSIYGEPLPLSDYLNQFFEMTHVDLNNWEYDGGEVNTISTVYDGTLNKEHRS